MRAKRKARANPYRRIDFDRGESPHADRPITQVVNLLTYAKGSGTAYNGEEYPAGYHNLRLNGVDLAGQRAPSERIDFTPYDFTGKSVLDIGCNQGGMLFSLHPRIAHGIGIDFDSRLVNAANKIRSVNQAGNLDFFVFDLKGEDLEIIRDFLPGKKVDIAFLLSVCMWIKNWRQVIDFTAEISDHLLFESNGTPEQQAEQIGYLKSVYQNVEQLREKSEDDKSQSHRMLYFCQQHLPSSKGRG